MPTFIDDLAFHFENGLSLREQLSCGVELGNLHLAIGCILKASAAGVDSAEQRPQKVAAASSPKEYLEAIKHNIVAEHCAFLSDVHNLVCYVGHLDVASKNFKSIAPCTAHVTPAEVAAGEPFELHEHLVVIKGKLGIVRVKGKGPAAAYVFCTAAPQGSLPPGHKAQRRVDEALRYAGADTTAGRPDILVDFGYVGDTLQKYAACIQMLASGAASWPPLLTSIANPSARREVDLFPPVERVSVGDDSPVPINAGQLDALRRLRHDVSVVQGPPGTGKSTFIYHLVTQVTNHTPDTIVLASCVQNKAVGAIAEKLAGKATAGTPLVPFIVFGNEQRIGPLAKRFTVEAQVKRDADVKRAQGALTETVRALKDAVERARDIVSDVPDAAAEVDEDWLRNDAWLVSSAIGAAAWSNMVDMLTPIKQGRLSLLRQEARELRLQAAEQMLERDAAQVSARRRILGSAKVVLCTVASVSRALREEALAPLFRRVQLAVLDEAGTTPEATLPLLLLLPRIKAIVGIGDQQQLAPFSHFKATGPRVCKAHLDEMCLRGSGCRFSHNTAGLHEAQRVNGPCPDMSSCPVGPRACIYSHDPAAKAAASPGFLQRVAAVVEVSLLTEQYRMHPRLCQIVSALFYERALTTAPQIAELRMQSDRKGMYFLPVWESEARQNGRTSVQNPAEARAAIDLARAQLEADPKRSVLVISTYKRQLKLLQEYAEDACLPESSSLERGLRLATVDQSQGSEADVVILSCVRSNDKGVLGFVSNRNRANVAISRARERLVILGNPSVLSGNSMWKAICDACHRLERAAQLAPLQ